MVKQTSIRDWYETTNAGFRLPR